MSEIETKTCGLCNTEKPLTEFSQRVNRGHVRTQAWCKQCNREYQRAYSRKQREDPETRKKHTEKAKATYRKRVAKDPDHIKRKHLAQYRLTLEQYNEMLKAQGGVCASCGGVEKSQYRGRTRNLAVDHDHKCCDSNKATCGKCTRALLCSSCNFALGAVNDDLDKLRALIKYLELRNTSA